MRFLFLSLVWLVGASPAFPETLPDQLPSELNELWLELSAFRLSQGLTVPQENPQMNRRAQARASRLAQASGFGHVDDRGVSFSQFWISHQSRPGTAAEILGFAGQPATLVSAWLASPPHKAVLSDPDWTEWGWGAVQRGQSWLIVLHWFHP